MTAELLGGDWWLDGEEGGLRWRKGGGAPCASVPPRLEQLSLPHRSELRIPSGNCTYVCLTLSRSPSPCSTHRQPPVSSRHPTTPASSPSSLFFPVARSALYLSNMSAVAPSKQLNPILAAYLTSLAARPLLTKASTAGVLSFLSEILAGHISKTAPAPLSAKDRTGIPPVDFLKQNTKAVQLAAYGFFISAPLGHTLLNILQKVFEGKTSSRAKLLMILVSNICISPIQQSVYIAAMAYIGGARTSQQMMRAWSMSFWPVMRLTWVISTLAMATAQKFLPMEQWVPFFTAIGAVAGCALNVAAKKRMAIAGAAAAKAKRDAEKKE